MYFVPIGPDGCELIRQTDDPNAYTFRVINIGDSYRVEKSGDETSGFVTKVVIAEKDEQAVIETDVQSKEKKSKASHEENSKPKATETNSKKPDTKDYSKKTNSSQQRKAEVLIDELTGKPLNKRQRQQLKRKARLEAEAAGKKKKSKTDTRDQLESSSVKQVTKEPQHKAQVEDAAPAAPTEADLISLQTAWATPLHPVLLSSLHNMNYTYPTPIQSATLSAAILGRRDIVGAAPTGSGKTLSYGIPILQWLLDTSGDGDMQDELRDSKKKESLPLQALILVPTREVS